MDSKNLTTLALAFIIGLAIGYFSGRGTTQQPLQQSLETSKQYSAEETKNLFKSKWESINGELRVSTGPNGSASYLKRFFEYTATEGRGKLLFFTDQTYKTPNFSLTIVGPYQLNESSTLISGAMNLDFQIDKIEITPLSQQFADFLNSQKAADSSLNEWEINETQTITKDTGEPVLGITLSEDTAEYDQVLIDGNYLFFGCRPADGSLLHQPSLRTACLQVPLRKVEQFSE